MGNYDTLVQVLDQIRKEAPSVYKKYYPIESDKVKMFDKFIDDLKALIKTK